MQSKQNNEGLIYHILAGTDRCGVYIGEAEWQAIADKIGLEISVKAPEQMMKEVIEFAIENSNSALLNLMLVKVFESRIAEYEKLKSVYPNIPAPYLASAKLTLIALQKVTL